jgi:predicted HTH domain antitoxin
MPKVSLDLPGTIFSSLRKEPGEFVKEMRLAAAVKWYEMGDISQEKAAEIAGISRSEFILALARYQIDFMQYSINEINSELLNAH